jgi:hypothetical protein
MEWFDTVEENFLIPGRNAAYDLVMESPIINKVHFPNLVLGYGEDTAGTYGGKYVWTVEYQCIEELNKVAYVGFNIYHREWSPPSADIAAIQAVVSNAGLGRYWNFTARGGIRPMGGQHCNYTDTEV